MRHSFYRQEVEILAKGLEVNKQFDFKSLIILSEKKKHLQQNDYIQNVSTQDWILCKEFSVCVSFSEREKEREWAVIITTT